MISPAAGTVFSGPSATFAWTAGSGATGYYLYLGTTGTGSHDITTSAQLTTTGVTITGLPVNGKIIYARLYTSINGALTYADYTYTIHLECGRWRNRILPRDWKHGRGLKQHL